MKPRHTFNQIRRKKSWRRKYQALAAVLRVTPIDAERIAVALYAMDHLVRAYEFSYTLQQLPRYPAVSLWQGERTFLLPFPGQQEVNPAPTRRPPRHSPL